MKHLLSKIPAINTILLTDSVKRLLSEYPERVVKDAIKKEVEDIKNLILKGELSEVPELDKINQMVEKEVKKA